MLPQRPPNRKRKASTTQLDSGRTRTDILRIQRTEYYYAFIAEYEEETWGTRIVGVHLELECILSHWFGLHPNPPWNWRQIGLASGFLRTTFAATPEQINNVNGDLDLGFLDNDIDYQDGQPAHLHEGNIISVRLRADEGLPLVVHQPSTANVCSLLAAGTKSIMHLVEMSRVRPPSRLIELRQFWSH